MLWGIARYEFRMAVGRWGVWLAFALAALLLLGPLLTGASRAVEGMGPWPAAGMRAFMLNLWMPLIAGIALADRFPRERTLHTAELIDATSASYAVWVIGKYIGGVGAAVLPVLAVTGLMLVIEVTHGQGADRVGPGLLALLTINVPALAFVGAFSIACPAVLPVRVYQVLFTGYWFWGNYLNPKVMPTIAGSLLTASGAFAADAFFGFRGRATRSTDAVLNLIVLGACAAAALASLVTYLRWCDRRR